MATSIRDFKADDADYAAVSGLVQPVDPMSAEVAHIMAWDRADKAAGRAWDRLVAIADDGHMVGFAQQRELAQFPSPGRRLLQVVVGPDERGNGVGHTLLGAIEARARAGQASELICSGPEVPATTSWMAEHGYALIDQETEQALDPLTVDRADLRRRRAALVEEGICIHDLASLQPDTADWLERLHRLVSELTADIPTPLGSPPPQTIDDFVRTELGDPAASPETVWIALHEGRWIGMSELRVSPTADDPVRQELTGTRRGWRGRGIATTLKQVGLEWSLAQGWTRVTTSNSSANAAMRTINQRLGFRELRTWGVWRKSI